MIKIRQQVKNHSNRRWIFNFCKILQNFAKFHGNIKIPQPAENCGPYWLLVYLLLICYDWLIDTNEAIMKSSTLFCTTPYIVIWLFTSAQSWLVSCNTEADVKLISAEHRAFQWQQSCGDMTQGCDLSQQAPAASCWLSCTDHTQRPSYST